MLQPKDCSGVSLSNWALTTGHYGLSSCFGAVPATLLLILIVLVGPVLPVSGKDLEISYNRDVRPILAGKCFQCHGPDSETREADLRLDQQADSHRDLGGYAAVVPGSLEESELISRITSNDPDTVMPPPESGDGLSETEMQTLRSWVLQGGEYESHWAFVPPRSQSIPDVMDANWCKDEVDRFILAELEKQGLKPQGPVDRRRLIRRLSLDLLGINPDPGEVERFVADKHPAAVKRLVDRLLASPEYGEKFASSWLDLARYSDTNGYEKDRPRSIWPYRSWVIDALNQDIPYDQFSIEQLAGDMLPDATQQQRIATGFHRNTMLNEEGGIDPLEYRFYALVDRVATTGTVWMGMTIGCAQCHTHKFDPITHDEYYGLMALLNQADEPDLIVDDPQRQAMVNRTEQRVDRLLTDLIQARLPSYEKWLGEELGDDPIHQAFHDWVTGQIDNARKWQTLSMTDYESTMPKLSRLEDGAILARGDITKRDVYRVRFAALPEMVGARSLKLEVLPDPSLPASGPGMAYYEGRRGDFFLSELRVWIDGEVVPLASASHSYGKISVGSGSADAANVLDGDGSTGWSTSGREGKASELVIQFEEALTESGELEVEMLFERHFAAAVGKFRLSVAAGPPANAMTVPPLWQTWLSEAEIGTLTHEQYLMLAKHFSLQSPAMKDLRKEIDQVNDSIPSPLRTLAMAERSEDDLRVTYRHNRGEYLQPQNEVKAGVPAIFSNFTTQAVHNRLEFAQWLVSEANPLAARVAVNRAWREFFGRGILSTAGDFGTQSGQPSHPELLDHLAVRFAGGGWSTKSLHRQLVLSAVYGQRVVGAPESDPENRLLSVFPARRLKAEVLRDSLLSSAGALASKMGGASVYPPQPKSVMQLAYGNPSWDDSQGEDRFRRSLYTFRKRTAPFAAFTTFDGPSGEVCIARRDTSTTPLQALTLLNDPMFLEIASALADRVQRDLGAEASDLAIVKTLFTRLLVREPSEAEIETMLAFVADLGSRDDRWMLVARAMMNLDESISIP